jgi:uncharacterized protein YjeT (DUF2065 family)
MDLLAAIALVLILEGLALAIFARSVPALLAELDRLHPRALRRAGVASVALGAVLYLLVRGWAAG